MEEKIREILTDWSYIKQENNIDSKVKIMPWCVFNTSYCFILDINNHKYPEICGNTVVKLPLYSFYEHGIEVELDELCDKYAIFYNEKWEYVLYNDEKLLDEKIKRKKIKMIGKIPFGIIKDFNKIGDIKCGAEYGDDEPFFYCDFKYKGEPYEEIYFKIIGDPTNNIPDLKLDKKMRINYEN